MLRTTADQLRPEHIGHTIAFKPDPGSHLNNGTHISQIAGQLQWLTTSHTANGNERIIFGLTGLTEQFNWLPTGIIDIY